VRVNLSWTGAVVLVAEPRPINDLIVTAFAAPPSFDVLFTRLPP